MIIRKTGGGIKLSLRIVDFLGNESPKHIIRCASVIFMSRMSAKQQRNKSKSTTLSQSERVVPGRSKNPNPVSFSEKTSPTYSE